MPHFPASLILLVAAAPAFVNLAKAADLPCSATPAKGVCGDADLMCFLDPTCVTEGGTGCNAGGVGQECRFCGNGGGGPPCPATSLPCSATPARGACGDADLM